MPSFVFGTLESASALIWCPGCSSCLCKAIPVCEAAWASGWPSSVVLSKVTAARWRRQVPDLERAARSPCACRVSLHRLGEASRSPNLTPQRERLPELDPDQRLRLRASVRVQHHAQDAVDAEPGMPEAGVGGVRQFGARRAKSWAKRSTA